MLFECAGINFLAMNRYSVPQSPHPEEVAIPEVAEVSRVQQSATECTPGFARVLVIAEHARWRIETDFAHAAIGKHAATGRENSDVNSRMGDPCAHQDDLLRIVCRW